MIAYLDSSVLLRVLLGEPDRLPEWPQVEGGVASALVPVECLRTLDRLRVVAHLPAEEIAVRRESVFRLTAEMELVEPTWRVLRRAAEPFPTPLGTLDAVHLATALLWAETGERSLVLATHDRALALAARASGLEVIGA
ncbi:MAG: type II toxin-antitoxin system VapC family toxin [Gemmatimonadota bacterium]